VICHFNSSSGSGIESTSNDNSIMHSGLPPLVLQKEKVGEG